MINLINARVLETTNIEGIKHIIVRSSIGEPFVAVSRNGKPIDPERFKTVYTISDIIESRAYQQNRIRVLARFDKLPTLSELLPAECTAFRMTFKHSDGTGVPAIAYQSLSGGWHLHTLDGTAVRVYSNLRAMSSALITDWRVVDTIVPLKTDEDWMQRQQST